MTDDAHCHDPGHDDPLAGWQSNAELLAMLYVENGMSFASIAELISEGLGTEIPVANVEAACRSIGIARDVVSIPSPVELEKQPKTHFRNALIDPHEPVGCRWIDGDPRAVWSFCQDTQRGGSVYCERHHREAYQRGTAAEAMLKAKDHPRAAAARRNARAPLAAE